MKTQNTIESLKEILLNRAILQESKTLKLRDYLINKDKKPTDSRLFNLYVGELMGMILLFNEIGMNEESIKFDWVWGYGI
jgi:hypothetical protein